MPQPERVRNFIATVESGVAVAKAAKIHNISERTGYRWKVRGAAFYERPARPRPPNKRAEAIIAYLRMFPTTSYTDTAEKFGVSGQRVSQIVHAAGLSQVFVDIKAQAKATEGLHPCARPGCGAMAAPRRKFCPEHPLKARMIWLTCATCGKDFERQASRWRPQKPDSKPFCSRPCFGQYMGTHYGWGPQRARKAAATAPLFTRFLGALRRAFA